MAGRSDTVYKKEIEPYLDQYMGTVFEDICRQYLIYNADVPFPIKEIGG